MTRATSYRFSIMTFCRSSFMPPTGWWSILIAIAHSWSNIWMCTLKGKKLMRLKGLLLWSFIPSYPQLKQVLVFLPVYIWNQCDRLGRLWLCYWSWFCWNTLRDSLSTLWIERITQILAGKKIYIHARTFIKSFTIPKKFLLPLCKSWNQWRY